MNVEEFNNKYEELDYEIRPYKHDKPYRLFNCGRVLRVYKTSDESLICDDALKQIDERQRILIFRDDYGIYVYDIRSKVKRHRVALQLLSDYADYWPEPSNNIWSDKPNYTREDIEKLPKNLQDMAITDLEAYEREVKDNETCRLNYEYYKDTLSKEDGEAAWHLIINTLEKIEVDYLR